MTTTTVETPRGSLRAVIILSIAVVLLAIALLAALVSHPGGDATMQPITGTVGLVSADGKAVNLVDVEGVDAEGGQLNGNLVVKGGVTPVAGDDFTGWWLASESIAVMDYPE